MAWQFLQEYKESISSFSMREKHFLKRVTQANPTKIYVPTPAAHHNLDLIKGLSLATTWKNAPASIRQPPQKKTQSMNQPPKTYNLDKQKLETAKQDLQNLSARLHCKSDIPNWPDNTQQSLTDASTTSSLMAKSHAMQQRFQELENTFCQLNTDT